MPSSRPPSEATRTLNQQFEIYLVDWYLHRVYDQLEGRLTDEIAPIPQHGP